MEVSDWGRHSVSTIPSTHTYSLSLTHIHTHPYTHSAHVCTHTLTFTHMHMSEHMCTLIHINTCVHMCRHVHSLAQTHVHTHTHISRSLASALVVRKKYNQVKKNMFYLLKSAPFPGLCGYIIFILRMFKALKVNLKGKKSWLNSLTLILLVENKGG